MFGSLTVYSDSAAVSPADYTADFRYGKIRLKRAFIDDIIKSGKPERLQLIHDLPQLPV